MATREWEDRDGSDDPDDESTADRSVFSRGRMGGYELSLPKETRKQERPWSLADALTESRMGEQAMGPPVEGCLPKGMTGVTHLTERGTDMAANLTLCDLGLTGMTTWVTWGYRDRGDG